MSECVLKTLACRGLRVSPSKARLEGLLGEQANRSDASGCKRRDAYLGNVRELQIALYCSWTV